MNDARILRWGLIVPAGLILLCGGEFLVTLGLKGILNLHNQTLLLIGLMVGGALLTIMLFYLTSWAFTLALYLAPERKTGMLLLASFYGAAKLVWVLSDLFQGDWNGLMVSLLFIATFAYFLYDALASRLETSAYLA